MDIEMQEILDRLMVKAKANPQPRKSMPEDLIGQKVVVRSHRVSGVTGNVVSYNAKTHHYWVWLEKKIKKKFGGKTQWHKCNAGNCRLYDPAVDEVKQLTLF